MDSAIKALIADDAESVRLALAMTLRSVGIDVVEAADGKEALALAQKQNFDLIITDVKMPGINGLELICRLRKMRQYKTTPILSLTNLNTESFLRELKAAGASGWIQKPFGRDGLLRTLDRLALTA